MDNLIKVAIVFAFASQALAQSKMMTLPTNGRQASKIKITNLTGDNSGDKIGVVTPEILKKNDIGFLRTNKFDVKITGEKFQLSAGGHDGNGGDSVLDPTTQKRVLLDLIEKDELDFFLPETVLKKTEGSSYYSQVSPTYVFMHYYSNFAVQFQDLDCKKLPLFESRIWGGNAFLLTVALSYLPGIYTSDMRCDAESFSKLMDFTYKSLKMGPVIQLRWAFTEDDLQSVNDEGIISIENPQTKKQLAIQAGNLVIINKKEFMRLDEESKQALFIHESVLRAVLLLNPAHIKEHGTQYVRAYVRSALKLFNSLGTQNELPSYIVKDAYEKFEIKK